jgi:hypothetical protein
VGSERKHLLDFYSNVNESLFIELKSLFESDPKEFNKSLSLISGNSSHDLIHMTCFYSLKNEEFRNKNISIRSQEQHLECIEIKANKGSVDIKTNVSTIQVRLKPMNKFTNKAFKLNCAVKDFNWPV